MDLGARRRGNRRGGRRWSPGRVQWHWPALPGSQERLAAAELVADCQAFLLGEYADWLDAQALEVPVWAWTNVLAHGTEDEVRRIAGSGHRGPVRTRAWWAARAYLATEVLAAVDRGAVLAELQRHVLAPLELRLSSTPMPVLWGPRHWVATVRSALEDYQHSHRR